MKKKNLVLLFLTIEEDLLGKDVFLVPYYLGKVYDLDVKIVYLETESNKNIPRSYRGVTLERIKPGRFHKETAFIGYLAKNAKNIDSMMLLHLRYFSSILGVIYKKLHPNGYLYVKADGLGFMRPEIQNSTTLLHRVAVLLHNRFLKSVDLLTVETIDALKIATSGKTYGIDLSVKTKMMINGFDEELLQSYNIKEKNYATKQNLIITVARLGVFEKNNEMLLDAAKKISFKDWKIKLIGPVTSEFREKVDLLFREFPNLRNTIILPGSIYDKRELWSNYNDAKVFVLTSRFEGFAIVYAEALRFNNFIVTTDVGGAKETLQLGNGEIVEQDNPEQLSALLQNIIDEKDINTTTNSINISWEKLVSSINFFK